MTDPSSPSSSPSSDLQDFSDLPFDLDAAEDFARSMTPTEVYSELLAEQELILTINPSDVLSLKQGLASAKYKANKRAKEKDLPIDTQDMIFHEQPSTIHPGAVDLHVSLGRKGAIVILARRLPDPDL